MKPLPATKGGNKKVLVETKMTSPSDPESISRPAPTTSASFPTTTVALQPTPAEGKGKKDVAMMSRLFDKSCDEILCPTDSFCVNDYTWGGSRCHCNLGKGGESCSDGRCSREEHGSGWAPWRVSCEHCDPNMAPSIPLCRIVPLLLILVIKLAEQGKS